jgi:uncharacterized membrane-anchored protein
MLSLRQFSILIAALVMLLMVTVYAASDTNKAYLVEVDAVIGPVTQELIERSIENAEAEGAAMVILQMDTPGGLDHSMREIIKAILDAHVPVITYVSPNSTRRISPSMRSCSTISSSARMSSRSARTNTRVLCSPDVSCTRCSPIKKSYQADSPEN